MHDECAIPVEAPDSPAGLLQGDSERNLARVPHRPHGQEVFLMSFATGSAKLEKLPGNHAGCRDDGIRLPERAGNGMDGLFAAHLETGAGAMEHIGFKSVFFNDQGIYFSLFGHMPDSLGHLPFPIAVFLDDSIGNTHRFQQGQRHFPLFHMLRLVMDAGLSPPSDDEQHRDAIDILVGQGRQGIDDVTLAGVLHIDAADPAGGKVVAGSQSDGPAFIGRDDVVPVIQRIGNIGADILQQGIRYSCKEVDTLFAQIIDECFR